MANLNQYGVRHLISKISGAIQDVKDSMGIRKVTYLELVDLKNKGQLIPGQQYRITDYVTTTAQKNTKSAGHQFDIIVTALNEYVLSEEANAVNHDFDTTQRYGSHYVGAPEYDNLYTFEFVGDEYIGPNGTTYYGLKGYYKDGSGYVEMPPTVICLTTNNPPSVNDHIYMGETLENALGTSYLTIGEMFDVDHFSRSNLSAWKIWYSLDNDVERFAWADSETGKGVIYRMIDEFGNDCPYDFKNILFPRFITFNSNGEMIVDQYNGDDSDSDSDVDYSNATGCYTFSLYTGDESLIDGSIIGSILSKDLVGVQEGIHDNIIKPYIYNADEIGDIVRQHLNNIVFVNRIDSNSGIRSCRCYSNIFGNNCYDNTFGNECYSNTFGYSCSHNTFEHSCNLNTFEHSCNFNTFGNTCISNTFGNTCFGNTFGNECNSNTFGDNCYYNTFGNECNYNTFGNICSSNTFGNSCHSNTFDNFCISNTFGTWCRSNTFGTYCNSNTFDNECVSNTFGDNCNSNAFDTRCNSNTFGNDCHSNTFVYSCSSNTFGNSCSSNTFDNFCSSNAFGNNCIYNTFGDYCYYNTFGNNCSYNIFGLSATSPNAYYRFIKFDSGNEHIKLNCTKTTSTLKYYQNVRIALGVNNTTTYKEISDPNVGQTFETVYRPANSQTITI